MKSEDETGDWLLDDDKRGNKGMARGRGGYLVAYFFLNDDCNKSKFYYYDRERYLSLNSGKV